MKSITVSESFTEVIPLPNESSSATLPFKVYLGSDGSEFDSGNLEYIVGIQWKLDFTPIVLDEIYIVEVSNEDGDIIFSQSYQAKGTVTDAAENASVAVSRTEIVNKALTLIGAQPITNLTDDTNNANIMNRVYKTALKSLLSECCWNFATKRSLLVESTEEMDWNYSGEGYVYVRPSDCIRIFGTNDDSATWREEGDYIISDTTALGIKYVYYNDVPYKFPPSFVEAFVDLLAYQAAFMIVNSSSKAEMMLEKYEKVSLPKARSENAQVGTQQTMRDDAWELAKYANGGGEA